MIKYSHQRIKQVLIQDYHITLKKMFTYKFCRYHGYSVYNMIDKENEKIIASNVTLDALRLFLESNHYSLKSE